MRPLQRCSEKALAQGGGLARALELARTLRAQSDKPLVIMSYLNPLLYASPTDRTVFRYITSGSNGAYSAVPGWDACTGLGSPNGAALLNMLAARRVLFLVQHQKPVGLDDRHRRAVHFSTIRK